MNRKSILLTVILTLASVGWAQTQSAAPQATPPKGAPGAHDQMGMEHHHQMMEMQKKHMDAMKADVDKMKASLEQLKANVEKIGDSAEKARWQSNVDMWTVMVGHMEQMSKHMDAMGSGGMMGHGEMHHGHKDGSSTPPPAEPKPE
jgi:cell division protein FtsW (lipid II flippase)